MRKFLKVILIIVAVAAVLLLLGCLGLKWLWHNIRNCRKITDAS